jgi:membrane-bound metal-dependent hydrolase YbcI (DUF457 family)
MKIDYKNPIFLSLLTICITFIISIIILLITQPLYVIEVSEKGKKINIYLLITHSLLYSVLCGIIILLYKTNEEKPIKVGFSYQNKFNPRAYSPN